jgi:hypothetical protein
VLSHHCVLLARVIQGGWGRREILPAPLLTANC